MMSTGTYTENLQAVGALAITLQQSFLALQQSTSQLLAAVGEAREAMRSSSDCCKASGELLRNLQAVLVQAGLDAGQRQWTLADDGKSKPCMGAGNLIAGHRADVEKQMLSCGEHVDKLMSLVGKHLLVANFSPGRPRTPDRSVADNTALPAASRTPSAGGAPSTPTASIARQLDYSEDVAVVTASILHDEGATSAGGAAPLSSEERPGPGATMELPSVPQVSQRMAGGAVLETSLQQHKQKRWSDDLVEAEGQRMPAAAFSSAAEPVSEDASHSTSPYVDEDARLGLAGGGSTCDSPGENGNGDNPALVLESKDAIAALSVSIHATANPALPAVKRSEAPTSTDREAPESDRNSLAPETAFSAAPGDSNGGLMFFDTAASGATQMRRKPRLSSDGITRPAKLQQKQAVALSKSSPPRSRAMPKRISSSNVGKDLQRQNTDEGDERKPPASLGSARETAAKQRSSSPRTSSPGSRQLGRKGQSNSRSSLSAASSSSSISDAGSAVSSPPADRRDDIIAAAASGEVRHLVAMKEGGAPLGLRICGGRGHGVFVDFVALASVADTCGMRVGDKILKFADCDYTAITHCAAGHSMLGLNGEIAISVIHRMREYESLPKGRDTQDNFFVRCRINRPSEAKKNIQDITTSPGDVYLVTETAPRAHEDSWRVHPVAVASGVPKDKHGFILSRRRAVEILCAGRTQDDMSAAPIVYEPVTLLKCDEPRPVVLLGAPQTVTSMRTYLLKEHDKTFCACPVYDVIGGEDMLDRKDVILLTNTHDSSRQTYVYKASVEQAAEKGLHCLLDVCPGDVLTMLGANHHPIVVLLLKNKSVVAAKDEYGIPWLHTGNVTLSNVARRDGQAVSRIVQEQQKNVVWVPDVPLTESNS